MRVNTYTGLPTRCPVSILKFCLREIDDPTVQSRVPQTEFKNMLRPPSNVGNLILYGVHPVVYTALGIQFAVVRRRGFCTSRPSSQQIFCYQNAGGRRGKRKRRRRTNAKKPRGCTYVTAKYVNTERKPVIAFLPSYMVLHSFP